MSTSTFLSIAAVIAFLFDSHFFWSLNRWLTTMGSLPAQP